MKSPEKTVEERLKEIEQRYETSVFVNTKDIQWLLEQASALAQAQKERRDLEVECNHWKERCGELKKELEASLAEKEKEVGPEEHGEDCECLECLESGDHYGSGYDGDSN